MDDRVVRYEPRGAAAELFRRKDGEILISGAAGTGKSVAALAKLHYACLMTPKVRCLIVRKTHTSLTASTLVSFKEKVAKEALETGALHYFGGSGSEPGSFRYHNGSRIIVGGLDRASRLLSTEFDLAFLDEATEATPEDVETIISRLRNGRLSFHQLLMATNPDTPTHHLKKRGETGKCVMLYSKHEDNPRLYDNGRWTSEGSAYISRLENLTGARYHRLRWGRWVAREGIVYEGWDPSIHLVDRFEVPDDWDVLHGVDFGFTAPFSWMEVAVDPDGRMYVVRELYATKKTVDVHARRVKAVMSRRPSATVVDHQAENRAVLERELGVTTTAAHKTVLDGIEAVQRRLRPAEDGRPRLFVMKDTLDARDQSLVEAGKPTCLVEEFPSYVWDARKEAPVKADDHALDNLRYLVAHLDLAPSREVTAVASFAW